MSEERVSRTARTHSCHGPRSLRGTGNWIAAARRQTLNAEKGVQQRTIQCHVAVFAARCTKSFERADRALRAHCPTRAPALVHAIACPQREVTGQKAGAGSRTEEAQEVIILPVHITDDARRGVELQQHGLLYEDLLHSRAYFLDFRPP